MLTDFNKKESAIKLRKQGKSYREIEADIGVNRSTLSGWLKNIELTKEQRCKLHDNWLDALIEARKKAILIHKKGRIQRQKVIRDEVEKLLPENKFDQKINELILATFYLAEGTKKESTFCIANSNPGILKGLINLMRCSYEIDESKFRGCLHLRSDQEENKLKRYWSNLLAIPEEQFMKSQFDKRTIKKTFERYKGVCIVYYHDMALQRRILYIGEKILKIASMGA